MDTIRVLAFAGSLRTASWNKKLIRIAAEGARAAGAEVILVDLRELPMPIYDGDIEAEHGLPPHAKAFKRMLVEAHGILISSPEYNSAFPAVLKNAIDWASRAEPGETSPVAFKGKIAGLMAASPGNLGGVRGLAILRNILSNLGVVVLPGQLAISRANEAFDGDGMLKDARQRDQIMAIGAEVVSFARKLGA